MPVYRVCLLFMINLIFFISCKEDNSNAISPNASQREKQYFDDYISPYYLWGFIDKKGKYVIEPKYDDLRDFQKGIACVSVNGRWGMINKNGDIIIDFKYLDIQYFSEGLALVEDFDQNKYYIDSKGNKIIECKFENCYPFHNNKARYSTSDFSGYINKDGSINPDMRFSTATDFSDGYAVFSLGDSHGIIDTNGYRVIEPKYSKIKINENIAVLKQEKSVKYYDLLKNEIAKTEYLKGTEFIDNHAIVQLDEQHGIIDKKYNFTPFNSDKIRYLNENRWSTRVSNGYLIVDNKGNPVSEKVYTNLFKYHCGIIGMEVNGAWGYVDLEGKEILEPQLPIIWDCSEDMVRFISNNGYGFFDTQTNILIAPQFIEARDFVEELARAQRFEL